MNKHVEMIIDYLVDGDDFKYNDNHGVLIRCKDCKYWLGKEIDGCCRFSGDWQDNDHCSKAGRKHEH